MSFAHDAKCEVLEAKIENECCKLAFLSSVIHSCGELTKRGKEIYVELKTDIREVYDKVNECLETLYGGSKATFRLDDSNNINRSDRYIISLPKEYTNRILFDCGIVRYNLEDDFSLLPGLDEHIIENECCLRTYVKGVFATASTSNIVLDEGGKQHSSSGYHWEFMLVSEDFATDFSNILFSLGISNKKSKRKNLYVIYIKEAEKVSDLLATVGAFRNFLKLQNEMTVREVRNNVNRQNNCINANITKTVNASVRQIAAIKKIEEKMGLDKLPDNLKELAKIRLEYPEESLENLTKLVSHPITKSGINHQLKRILKIADKL